MNRELQRKAKDRWILDCLASGVYRIERDGRVIRVHKSPQAQTPEREVKTHKHPKTGYRHFTMSWKNQQKCVLLHRVVALAHIPNPLGLPEVDHNDGDRDHCHADNLEWVTREENEKRARARGSKSRAGEKNTQAKLTRAEALEIRNSTDSRSVLATRFGVSKSTIEDIQAYRSWKDAA